MNGIGLGGFAGRIWLAVAGTVMFLGLLTMSDRAYAMACPKPCWIELKCCCITPCPVTDAQAYQEFVKGLKNFIENNKLYGVKMPGLDSVSSAKTPIDAAKAAAQGLNVLQQATRNVWRGPKMDLGLGVDLPAFEPHIAETEVFGELPPVTADTEGGVTTLEKKAGELDDVFWEQSALSRNQTTALKAERMSGARLSSIDAMAYALVKRQEVAKSSELAAQMEQRMGETLTISDDWRINAEAKALVNSDMQAFQEMMGYLVEVRGARKIANDSEFTKGVRSSSNSGVEPGTGSTSDKTYQFAQARSACEVATRRMADEHNELTEINDLKKYLPSLMKTVDDQENRLDHAWDSNQSILSVLASLYEDPLKAWRVLSAELASRDQTSYFDQSRYSAGRSASLTVIPDLFTQAAQTRFGTRLKTPNCTPQLQEQAACLPYAGPVPAGGWLKPIATINAYYTGDRQYDAYNRIGGISDGVSSVAAKALPALPAKPTSSNFGINGNNETGNEAAQSYAEALAARQAVLASNWKLGMDQASVLLQYRQEAFKRKAYWDVLRRGGGDFGPGLSSGLKSELLANAPACFTGPMSVSAANLATFPEWFDVSPTCGWRSWSSGAYAGEQIGHEFLGGTDSAIWSIQNEISAYEAKGKGRAEIEKWANGAQKFCATAESLAAAAGREDVLPEIDGFQAVIDAVRADTQNLTSVNIP